MAKRLNPRVLKANRAYTIPELAQVLGVSVGAVRGWARDDLPALKAQRPYLVLGSVARSYLEARQGKAKAKLQPDQLYCMSCKAPRRPWGMLVDLIDQPGSTARIMGLCEACQMPSFRMIGKAQIPQLGQIFDVTRREDPTP
ncbi:helix-turn-helix domain-containing protein [Pararhodobacter oceanensis]|uniref:DNA-binding protein n=1 Tax=Pararhodobacter oceanensis TaxID=2172121 RepID=A0A2T8HQN1_9RHOB|nr:helix-turn-helix domain-containing protein [Pararhodobacter oceanensis]PVH27724.1 hypothetical protein DDE20_15550 [Pararhodobacter oceanensis]